MRSYDETSLFSNESLSDLRREVVRYKEAEAQSTTYIAELEARLARSDESILTLQQAVENLERSCERKREEIEILQMRLETLTKDGESWRSDLEQREKKVMELEVKMKEWERKRKEAGEDRTRLSSVVGEVEQARRGLEELNVANANGSSTSSSSMSTPTKDPSVENQLAALQQTHAATLADLTAVSTKYHDALREIADLAAQIQEAKLSNPTIPEHPNLLDTPTPMRRVVPSKARDSLTESAPSDLSGKRHFFRPAVSAESLHTKYDFPSLARGGMLIVY